MKKAYSLRGMHFTHHASRPLGLWLLCATLLNLLLCTTGGHGGDIAFWVDWMKQLQNKGYGLDANYPPLYIHWLWLVTKFESALHIAIAPGPILRFLTHTPIILAHALLLLALDKLLQRAAVADAPWNTVMAIAALNPAVLMNGPVWGQVDLLYCLMLVISLGLLIESERLGWVFPLLVTALLTKFQTICVAPLLLPLFWHRRRNRALWLGLIPAVVCAALLLLPYWLSGNVIGMMRETYLKASSMYPVATFNANNLWYLFDLNSQPDSLYIFNRLVDPDGWRYPFTPKHGGILLCSLWGLWIMLSSWRRDESELHWRNAFLAGLGFFLFLPAMHERYLMPAVVLALAAAARHPRFIAHAVILSVLSASNMVFILHPEGGLLPYVVSALTVLFAIAMLMESRLRRVPWLQWAGRVRLRRWGWLCVLLWAITAGVQVWRVLPRNHTVIDATREPPQNVVQAWGSLQTNFSIDGNLLTVGKKRFDKGFGTHAASTITLRIPEGARSFSALVGLDDESKNAEVEFRVNVDGVEVWRSGTIKTGDAARSFDVDVSGKHTLDLITDPLESNFSDHADWLSPRFYR